MTFKTTILTGSLMAATLLSACSEQRDARQLLISFQPEIAGKAFACNSRYDGMGNGEARRYEARDFRWYASDFLLRDAQRREVPLRLENDGSGLQYQDARHNVALLGAISGCDTGTETPMNLHVSARGPAGDFTEMCFTLGVPFALNHSDPTAQGTPSPLNLPAMNWFWRGGRKFLKIDGIADPEGAAQQFNFHLGSTGCSNAGGVDGMGEGREAAPDAPCAQPNTPQYCFALEAIEAGQAISIDPARVAANTDLSRNTEGTAPGCMGFINDPECIDIMPRLGLDYPLNGEMIPAQSPVLFELTP